MAVQPSAPPTLLGALIAGGRASRFGSDKALAIFGGEPLIGRARALLAPHVADIVVCGRTWGRLPSVADRPAAGLGPLGGLAGALAHAAAGGYTAVLAIGCDMPWLPGGLIESLVARAPAWCADAPVLGCWPAALAEPLAAHLTAGGDRSIRRWGAAIGGVAIPSPAPLPNINTSGDLAALRLPA